MEPKFWGEAMVCGYHIINQIPTHVIQGMNPYDKWSGSKPTVSHFKMFGSSAWTHIPKEKWNKSWTQKYNWILVAYREISKAYHLYDPSIHEVIKNNNVVFKESLSHGLQLYFLLLSTNVL